MYNNIKYWLSCIFFLLACFSFVAQAQQATSGGSKISPEEKARLQKQFGPEFRINDNGSVQFIGKTPTVTEDQQKTEPAKDNSDLNFLNVEKTTQDKKETDTVIKENPLLKDNNNNITVIKKEATPNDAQDTEKDPAMNHIDTILKKNNITEEAEIKSQDTIEENPPVQENYNTSIIIKKEKKDPVLPSRKENPAPHKKEEVITKAAKEENISSPESEEHIIKMADGTITKNVQTPSSDKTESVAAVEKKTDPKPEKKEKQLTESKTTKKGTTTKKSGLGRKDPPKYDSLEDSFNAVQALIDKIESKSSSNKLPNSLKNDHQTIPQSEDNQNVNFMKENNVPSSEDLYKKFGDDPSYFVNGILVNKEDAEKITPREIISREVKTRNTTTGNPNGEIWIKTK